MFWVNWVNRIENCNCDRCDSGTPSTGVTATDNIYVLDFQFSVCFFLLAQDGPSLLRDLKPCSLYSHC